jgi:hypothetical protein
VSRNKPVDEFSARLSLGGCIAKTLSAQKNPVVGLGSHFKNLSHEFEPFGDGSFRYSLNLPFADHVHHFISF